jgi:hypothetical protein
MARSRRSRRDRNDKALGLVLAVVGLLLITALAGGAWWLHKSKEPLDADNCPRSGPRAVHIIMIDRSDPITGQQAQGIRQQIERIKNDARFGTQFDIYTFEGDTKNEMHPTVRVCAPGRPEDANELIENPDFVRRRYQERFSNVLDQEIATLLQVSTLPNSPIIESIRAAAITSFGPLSIGKIPLHVTMVSDMVQNTSLTSHFRSEPNFAQLSKSSAWSSLQPNLKRAEVDILYLLRPEARRGSVVIQNRGHQLFWEQLIAASGGRLDSILPL